MKHIMSNSTSNAGQTEKVNPNRFLHPHKSQHFHTADEAGALTAGALTAGTLTAGALT